MAMLMERVSKKSLDFRNQRKAYLLRTVHNRAYESIAQHVVNRQGEHPCWGTVRNVCQTFSTTKAMRPYNYHKCGRKAWKLTRDVQRFVLRKLIALRAKAVVTSSSLAEAVAREKGVIVEASSIRKLLQRRGYRWLPRSQKRKYSEDDRARRMAFARSVLRLSDDALRFKLAMSLDGVVLSMPPTSDVDRFNYCWGGFSHMWRKPGESNCPTLGGNNDYESQCPLSRAIPSGVAAPLVASRRCSGTRGRRQTVRSGPQRCARGSSRRPSARSTQDAGVGHGLSSATTSPFCGTRRPCGRTHGDMCGSGASRRGLQT